MRSNNDKPTNGASRKKTELPDYYPTAAKDVIEYCSLTDGRTWIDLGCGSGSMGLAVMEQMLDCVMALVDPSQDSLQRAIESAKSRQLSNRTFVICAQAESLPFADNSVEAVISRGSFYFWQDRAQGLREVNRILKPSGRAMIGGGLGKDYPQWARQEFIRRRRESDKTKGPEAMRKFTEARSPETFKRLANEANISSFEIHGEGALSPDDPDTGIGNWLRFVKPKE